LTLTYNCYIFFPFKIQPFLVCKYDYEEDNLSPYSNLGNPGK